MKKNPTKNQPINVQLTKDDLKELLTVLKDFMAEEISGQARVMTHRLDCHNSRIIKLERIQQYQEVKRVSFCTHDYRIDSIQYFKTTHRLEAVTYKCVQCKLEWQKLPCFLTCKEKKALRKLGVEV